MLNLACVGARPLAVVNCLNFGNPEHPEVMWQLSEAVDGMAEACEAFAIPVIGGNVSLYNESLGTDIDPTPVIGMLGVVDRLERRPPGVGLVDGGRLMLLGVTQPEVSGSRWARELGHRGGHLPSLDLDMHRRVVELTRQLVVGGVVDGVHDVATGGLGVALAEMVSRSGLGATVARVADAAELFSESPSRVVLCVDPERVRAVESACEHAGVPVSRIGVAGGDRLSVKGLLDLALVDVAGAWRQRIPTALGAGTAQD
jgi:phosphoribosylformylglycinamidine synthase